MARTEALVNAKVLRWAREAAGYTLGEAAGRLRGIREAEARLRAWEDGSGRPTVSQARRLAELYRRPLATFFLARPPEEPPPPTDYRGVASGAVPTMSPAVRWHVRRLRDLRQAALDLAESEPETFPSFPVRARLEDQPDGIAERLRRLLGVSFDTQASWRSEERAWGAWRKAVESQGCLVFVVDRVAAAELDGFSLAFGRAPVIAVNGSRQIGAGRRVFTLMHELAHVALRSEGLCTLEDRAAQVEAFCNRVAAALLMPATAFRKAAAAGTGKGWSPEQLRELAASFSVSQHAVFVRLVSLGLASQSQYETWRMRLERAAARPERVDERSEHEGGPSFYTLYLHRMSFQYLRQVFESYHADQLSLAELSDHLGVRPSTALALEGRFLERLRGRAS